MSEPRAETNRALEPLLIGLGQPGFTEVATQAQGLINTFNELRNRVHELYQHAGLAESMLVKDQPRRVSRRGRRIGNRIEKESKKRLRHHV